MKTELLVSTDQIEISNIGEDSCRIRTGSTEVVLSYDAAYDLALRLAQFIQYVDANEPVGSPRVH